MVNGFVKDQEIQNNIDTSSEGKEFVHIHISGKILW